MKENFNQKHMKNTVKSLIALMAIAFAAVSCNPKTEKAGEGDSTVVAAGDSSKIDSTQVVKIDTIKQDSTATH